MYCLCPCKRLKQSSTQKNGSRQDRRVLLRKKFLCLRQKPWPWSSLINRGCKLQQPDPQGDHGHRKAHHDSALQIGGLDCDEDDGHGRRRWGFLLGQCSFPYCCHCAGLTGGDEHLELVIIPLSAGTGAITLFCVPEDEYRAGRHLHGPGDPLEGLGWGTENHRQ
jgi:hypothetical protein